MAVFLYEIANSRPVERSVDSASITLKWIATGSQLENLIAEALLLVAPIVWDTLPRTKYTLDPMGGGNWMCTVEYSLSANTQTDEPEDEKDPTDDTDLGPESSFDLTAGTAHITQSLKTKMFWKPGQSSDTPPGDADAYGGNATITSLSGFTTTLTLDGYAWAVGSVGHYLYISGPGITTGSYLITGGAGATVTVTGRPGQVGVTGGKWVIAANTNFGSATNLKQAIALTNDSVDGCDIYVPKFEFVWSQQVFPVNLPYLRRLRSIVGKTNSAAWRGFQRGELLYLGATGSAAPGQVWKIAHKFAAGENQYGIPVSPSLVIPQKNAWDFVWCPYGYGTDNTKRFMVPLAAYVEQVYQEEDFTKIGLGK